MELVGNAVRAHGRFEFVVHVGKFQLLHIVNYLYKLTVTFGCEVAVEKENVDVVYSVVTTFHEWIFLRSSNDDVLKDDSNPIKLNSDGLPDMNDLTTIIGKLITIFKEASDKTSYKT